MADPPKVVTEMVANYPTGRINDRIDALRLKLLVPLALLAGLVAALALLAADRISRALSQLSQRALALVRLQTPLPPSHGDELEELNVALDTMSSELTHRMTELEGERARLKTTVARYGETLAATHDLRVLLSGVLELAVQATKARGGRLLRTTPRTARPPSRCGWVRLAARVPTCRWWCRSAAVSRARRCRRRSRGPRRRRGRC